MNHVKVKRRVAIIEFEDSVENEHSKIIEELIHLIEHGFKSYVFDFTWINNSMGSNTVGFIISAVMKLTEHGSKITIRNIKESDLEILNLVGLFNFSDKNDNLTILIRKD